MDNNIHATVSNHLAQFAKNSSSKPRQKQPGVAVIAVSISSHGYAIYSYTVSQKTASFYLCNNFVKSFYIAIIIGVRIPPIYLEQNYNIKIVNLL